MRNWKTRSKLTESSTFFYQKIDNLTTSAIKIVRIKQKRRNEKNNGNYNDKHDNNDKKNQFDLSTSNVDSDN